MAIFYWLEEYAIGHDKIDSQHRQIVDILNQLYTLLNDSGADRKAEAELVFDQLANYVTEHFAFEEDLMFNSGYPNDLLIEHKATHSALLSKVQHIVQAHQEGDAAALSDLLPYLYGNWLIEHICGTDKAYAPYVVADKASGQDVLSTATD
jgi:hemerythrin